MMRPTLLAAVIPMVLAGPASAFAQEVVVEEAPSGVYVVPTVPAPPASYYYEYYDVPPPPSRIIRYYPYRAEPDGDAVVVRPRAPATCGPNSYWNGHSCVYARW